MPEDINSSVNNEAVAEPQTIVDTGESNVDNSTSDTANQNNDQKSQQSADENAKYAAARRQAETEKKALEERYNTFAKKYGFNTYDEMERAQQEAEAQAQRQKYIEQTGVDPEALKPIIDNVLANHPALKAAQTEQANARINNAISELHKDFPELKDTVKTSEDVDKLPNAKKIAEYLKKGNSLSDSYKLANWSDIQSGKAAAAKQAALNSINSKNHIQPTGAAAEVNDINVPPEVENYYHRFFPKWTEEQIKKHYAKG